MHQYYVNDYVQPDGQHEVHIRACPRFPSNYTYLGEFLTCEPALRAARQIYPRSNGCYRCCRACHTG